MSEPRPNGAIATVSRRGTEVDADRGINVYPQRAPVGWVLPTIVVLAALYVAQAVFIPIVLAVMGKLLLSPAVRWLGRRGVPQAVAAPFVLLASIGLVAIGVYQLAEPATALVENLPRDIARAKEDFKALMQPISDVAAKTKDVEKIAADVISDVAAKTKGAEAAAGVGGASASEASPPATEVTLKGPSLGDQMLTGGRELLLGAWIVAVLLLFLLAQDQSILRKAVRTQPTFAGKRRVVLTMRRIERDVSRYLVTVVTINIGVGAAVTLLLTLAGMKNAILWGVLAAVGNMMPFVGPFVVGLVLALNSFLQFGLTSTAFLVPVGYFTITGIEGMVFTPWLLGSRLSLSTVAILVSLIVWSWLWGFWGAILAVPMLVAIWAYANESPRLRPVAILIGR